ncbi:hypothetical protein HOH45_05720, partial [bacterium]|nr:hypothetical protein [bacterium]
KQNGDIVARVNERPRPQVSEQQKAKQNLKTAMSKLKIPLKSSMFHGTFEIFQDACKQLEAQKKTAALSDILKLGKKITHNKKTSYSAEFLKKREEDNDKLTSVLKKANSRLTTLQKQKKPLQVK